MTDTSLKHAGVGRRLAALFYDFLLILGILLSTIIIVPLIMTLAGSQGSVTEGQTVHEITPLLAPVYFQLYSLLVIAVFNCWFWCKSGQTLGMQSWRLKLVTQQGETVSLRQGLLRLLAASLSLLCLGAGYWWIWLDKEGLSWHDRLSGTRVIVLPKKK